MAGKILRIAVAVVLTAVVLYWSHPSQILAATANADWRWLLAALGLVFVDRALMAMRWIDLLVALAPGSRPPLGAVLRVFFTSSFVSNFVPSVASDLYRAWALSRYDVHLAESTASVLMDRALGVLSVVIVAAAALPFAPAIADRASMIGTVAALFALCAVAAAVVFSEEAARMTRAAVRWIPLRLLHRVTDVLTDAVRRYAEHHRELLRVLVVSVVVQVIRVLQAWCLGVALGIALPLPAYFVFVPLIVFVMQVPVSVNGIGTTQAAFAWTFVPQGAPAPAVFALSVLFLALGIVGTLPGGVTVRVQPRDAWAGSPAGIRVIAGLVYAAVYLLALAPGLPLGFALFGRRHPAGWTSGALLGYALTSLALWAPIRLGVPSILTFAAAWLLVGATVWLTVRGRLRPLVGLPPWTRRDARALAAVLALTLVIAAPPLIRAGETDRAGNRYYRAYFTADFVWHTALTAEIAKFASPPRNPYLSARPIHYYWTYFVLPGAVAGVAPGGPDHVQTYLKVNAAGSALLFAAAIFLFAWTALPRAWPVACGVAIAIAASSAEGAFALWRYWQRGVPLSEVRNLNIDALSNWWMSGLRVDGLQRCFWWVPQHSMAYALGLVALTIGAATGSGGPTGAIVLSGIALAGAAMMNPFVGGIFALAWGTAVVLDAAGAADPVRRVLRHAIAVVPVALAIVWCIGNQMVEGGGSALQFGWLGDARHAPIATLFLSLGPVLVPAGIGAMIAVVRRSPMAASSRPPEAGRQGRPDASRDNSRGGPLSPNIRPALVLAVLALALLYFVRLNVDSSWIGFRAGQMFLVAAPVLIARALTVPGRWKPLAIGTVVLAFLAGFPTVAIDAYNAQDITNFSESPIGPWTVTVTADQRAALKWLRDTTPLDAVVQMEPMVRARTTWSLIPSFAQRRMAAGLPISLLGGTTAGTEYWDKSERVKTMYATGAPREAWEIARSLRIDYIWVDSVERAAYGDGVAKFAAAPAYFAPAFRQGDVAVYRVE